MNKNDLRKVRDALAVATTPLAKDRQTVIAAVRILDAALAAPEPEPKGYFETITGRVCRPDDEHRTRFPMVYEPLYTAPPSSEWQGLTENDWDAIQNDKILIGDSSVVWAIRLTETLLRTKNEVNHE